MYVKPDEHVLH